VSGSASTDSPLLELASDTSGPEAAFVISTWPDRAKLYPNGLKADTDKCNAMKDVNEKRLCLWRAVLSANQPFCAEMAVLTGHWLGLKAPKGADPHCKDTTASLFANEADLDGSSKPTPKPPAEKESVFMKGAFEMSPKDFFDKASLSRADLKSVFAPACSAFRNLPDEKTLANK